MKKSLFFAVALLSVALFNSCTKEVAKKYTVTVTVNADGAQVSDLKNFTLSALNESGDKFAPDTTGGLYKFSLIAGAYTFDASAESDEFNYNANVKLQVAADADLSLTMTPLAKQESGIIFKEVYFCGVMSYYFKDGFYELFNNSDEVKYLDGIIMCCVHRGYGNVTPWADSTGVIPTDYYPTASWVMYFPGNGTDYPLQPGESTVIATMAFDHSSRGLEESDVKSPVNLEKADWELKVTSEVYVENPDVKGMKIALAPKYGYYYMPAVSGQPMMLAKLPEGVDPVAFANDSTNYHSYKGGSPTFCIPAEYVIDAIDIQYYGDDHVISKSFNPAQDKGYTYVTASNDPTDWTSPMYCGKSLRRKCLNVTSTRFYLKDTNNSSEDFILGGQTPVVRRTFTKAD